MLRLGHLTFALFRLCRCLGRLGRLFGRLGSVSRFGRLLFRRCDGLGAGLHRIIALETACGRRLGRGDIGRQRLRGFFLAIKRHNLGGSVVLQRRDFEFGPALRVHLVGLEQGGGHNRHRRHDGEQSDQAALVLDTGNLFAMLFVFGSEIQILQRRTRAHGSSARRIGAKQFLKLVDHANETGEDIRR